MKKREPGDTFLWEPQHLHLDWKLRSPLTDKSRLRLSDSCRDGYLRLWGSDMKELNLVVAGEWVCMSVLCVGV